LQIAKWKMQIANFGFAVSFINLRLLICILQFILDA